MLSPVLNKKKKRKQKTKACNIRELYIPYEVSPTIFKSIECAMLNQLLKVVDQLS